MTEEMQSIIKGVLDFFSVLVVAGVSARVIYCLIRIIYTDEQEGAVMKKRIKHAVLFAIIAVIASTLVKSLFNYFK